MKVKKFEHFLTVVFTTADVEMSQNVGTPEPTDNALGKWVKIYKSCDFF